MGVLVIEDIHSMMKEPFYTQSKFLLDHIFEDAWNNPSNSLIFGGDLVEAYDSPSEIVQLYLDYFLNKSRFKRIYILQGNHDVSMFSLFLSAFLPLSNVEVITTPKAIDIDGMKFLMMPYVGYYTMGFQSMSEYYKSGVMDPLVSQSYDYGIAHLEDETNHFTNDFVDCSMLKVGSWFNAHIHIGNKEVGGRYLGAATLRSSVEGGRTPSCAFIESPFKHRILALPKFLDFYSVSYPDALPDVETPLALWTINDALDKDEAIRYYQDEARRRDISFFPLRVVNKVVKDDSGVSEKGLQEASSLEMFQQYEKVKKVIPEVSDICKKVIAETR